MHSETDNYIVAAFSALSPVLEAEAKNQAEQWGSEACPITIILGAMAGGLSEQMDVFSDRQLSDISALIEKMMTSRDSYVDEVVATGFVESLWNMAAHVGDMHLRRVAQILGPTALAHCRGWDAFHGATFFDDWDAEVSD